MTITTIAQVRRVLHEHSRALVVAVDAEGCEYKLEMPLQAAQAVQEGRTMLVLSWSFHSTPLVGAVAPDAATSSETLTVDEEFHALTTGRTPKTSNRSASQGLADLLGIKLD